MFDDVLQIRESIVEDLKTKKRHWRSSGGASAHFVDN
jgi:hypothetical protein